MAKRRKTDAERELERATARWFEAAMNKAGRGMTLDELADVFTRRLEALRKADPERHARFMTVLGPRIEREERRLVGQWVRDLAAGLNN